jgi:thioesterase domain-containing protein
MSRISQIENVLHTKIPLTRAMGVRVEDYDDERLTLSAPWAANINHIGTAFGGSLNALLVLAGYALLWLELQDTACHIVIKESKISYDLPVGGDLRAICKRPELSELETFKERFQTNGRARITLSATIEDRGNIAAPFEGTFVAMR